MPPEGVAVAISNPDAATRKPPPAPAPGAPAAPANVPCPVAARAAGTAIAVSTKPPPASQRPAKLAGDADGAAASRRAVNVPSSSMVTSASSKPSQRPVSGNHAL
jgi:hypothetical protein